MTAVSPATWQRLESYRRLNHQRRGSFSDTLSDTPRQKAQFWLNRGLDCAAVLCAIVWSQPQFWQSSLQLHIWSAPIAYGPRLVTWSSVVVVSSIVFLLVAARWIQYGMKVVLAIYQLIRIAASCAALGVVRLVESIQLAMPTRRIQAELRQVQMALPQATSYAEYQQLGEIVDVLQNAQAWKEPRGKIVAETLFDAGNLAENIMALTTAVETQNVEEVMFVASGCLKRNKLGIDTDRLHLHCHTGTKRLIALFQQQVVAALKFIAHAPDLPKADKLAFFNKIHRSYGQSALLLSGGGALGMMHMGVVKSMLKEELLPTVISGSSGGSILAGMLACKTVEELKADILVDHVSTIFPAFRWFPPLWEQLQHFWREGVLMDCAQFEATTQRYYGTPYHTEPTEWFTFQDAFEKTGRHVSITVSASEMGVSTGPRKLLLNHIHTPNVLIWSAVAVSCSLPGIMKGKTLMARDANGKIVPYLSLGDKWVDGSLQHDLPFETLGTCFNVTNFIVSQVNPHIVPLLSRDVNRPHERVSGCKTLEQYLVADLRHRMAMLGHLGLFPSIHGQPFSQMFKQSFIGNVTIVPQFSWLEAIGLKAITNPTRADMSRYIRVGEEATWPKLNYIRHLSQVEKCLAECLRIIDEQG